MLKKFYYKHKGKIKLLLFILLLAVFFFLGKEYCKVICLCENQVGTEVFEENIFEDNENTEFECTVGWRIEIPIINVDAPVISGTEPEDLNNNVGHFLQTDTWMGNVALAGHNRGYEQNYFQDIKSLNIGDEIIYETEYGVRSYVVEINEIIECTDWSYIENTEDNRITLITCEEDKPEYRRCIQAVETIY